MSQGRLIRCVKAIAGSVALLVAAFGTPASAQTSEQASLHAPDDRTDTASPLQTETLSSSPVAKQDGTEHPLTPVIRAVRASLDVIDATIKDYSCTLVKREQIGGKIGEYEYVFMKVRHEPYSLYMYYLGPKSIKGREVLYVANKNDGKLWSHEGRQRINVAPRIFSSYSTHEVTQFGIRNLAACLLKVAESESKYDECEVRVFKDAKVNGRVCTTYELTHSVRRDYFRFHKAQIFIDDELRFPIRFASYNWPSKPGETPALLEEYTYLNVKLNNNYQNADFDEFNADYHFH